MSHLDFWILTISINFCPFRNDLSGNTVRPQASGFQKLAKIDPFGIFNELLSTQNVDVARFARNVECDFFGDFQTLCQCGNRFMMVLTARISFRVWQWFFCPRRLLSKSNFCYYRSTNEDKCLRKVQKTSGDILFFFWHNWKSAL